MRHVKIAAIGLAFLLCASAVGQSTGDGLGSEVRGFADATAGAPIAKGADKVLFFDREGNGVVVIGISVVPMINAKVSAPADAVAVMRTRSRNAAKKRMPDAEDLQFAAQIKLPVFIVGEWKKPPIMWEVDGQSNPRRFREISQQGKSGAWQSLTK